MTSSFPASLDSLVTTHVANEVIRAATDNDESDAINKIEAKLGAGTSAAAANTYLHGGGAAQSAWLADQHSQGGVLITPAGAQDVVAWRAPYLCTVTAVRGYRAGGTGATVNARVNGANALLSADLSLTSADTWMTGSVLQNVTINAGDVLWLRWTGVTGSPAQVGIQVDFVRTG